MTSSDDDVPVFPKQWAPYKWPVVGLVSSCIFLLLMMNPSPLHDFLCRGNYHWVHIPWSIFGGGLAGVTWLLPCMIPLSTFIVIRKHRLIRTTYAPRLLLFPIWAMLAIAIFVGLPVLDGGYYWQMRERLEALSSERNLLDEIGIYANNHQGKWPPHLAALGENIGYLQQARYRYSKTPVLPDEVKLEDPSKWKEMASIVESHVDFVYLGTDLTDALAQRKEAPQIIILYGKYDLPEIPVVSFNYHLHTYEYGYVARPVAFADGHVRLVPIEELAKVFAEHNAARLKVGLPEQTIRP